MRRILLALMMAGTLLLGTSVGAGAFEPPQDPANKFSCPGGNPVAGHPGSAGLEIVVPAKSLGPWNAVFNGTPVTLCR